MKSTMNLGTIMALGTGIGTALGVATDHLANGVAFGVAAGIAFAALLKWKQGSTKGKTSC